MPFAVASIGVSIAVLGLKYLAYVVTGSIALLSDAIETTLNVLTAIAALVAIRISARPADADHPYGHAKAEYFSAVLEGVLIIVAALAILREAWYGFHNPRLLDAPALGVSISAAATVLNGIWSRMLIVTGRRRRSPALVADGTHLLTDVWTSGGIIIGVVLVAVSGWLVLDPLIAALVALYIVWSGWGLVRESVDGLMDAAVPPEELDAIEATVRAHLGDAIEAHSLRSRRAGRITFIDFHLVVDRHMSVECSHAICDRIEAALKADHPDSLISIHVEPDNERRGGPIRMTGQD